MPLIVDREQVRQEILHALQQCLEEKPLLKVSMRDIAAKAKIAHSKINYYFNTKEKLLLAYIEFFAISYQSEIEH
ncbi:TetR family transcriptional regulator, partial [Bacillus thuringiensis]|uniref:TetR/AcrR family transcriptional regulator n=2 Tax=Bacillus TaxID=1386 RepID=UPI000CB5350E